ncbi:MAG: hypothetical protein Q8L85_07365 [Alphaproteobacteria bacterium]|nr:hypothetical protein [Alphaproteobacteria bacterium]
MTKFIKNIVLVIAIIVFTNTVSAHKWPVFSTKPTNLTDIELNNNFDYSTQLSDANYNYKFEFNDSNFQLVNILIAVSSTSKGELIPSDPESIENKITYSIYLNRNKIGKINIERKK